MKNTAVNYLYRDASNYKVQNQEILTGEITEEQKQTILGCLKNGDSFIPSQLGLSEVRFSSIQEDDGPWFELCADGFSLTSCEPTVDMTVDELVTRFEKAKDNWDETGFNMLLEQECQNDSNVDYILAIEAACTAANQLPALVFGIYGEDAMQEKVSELVSGGYPIKNIHVFPASAEID